VDWDFFGLTSNINYLKGKKKPFGGSNNEITQVNFNVLMEFDVLLNKFNIPPLYINILQYDYNKKSKSQKK